MKNILKYCVAVIFLIGVASCSKEIADKENNADGGLTIKVISSILNTKASMAGVDDLNENKINNLHYFIYPMDPSNPSVDPTTMQPMLEGHFSGLNAKNEYTIQAEITDYSLNYEIFPRPYATCQVYVIANLPAGIDINNLTDKSVPALRSIALSADFVGSVDFIPHNDFVMEGLGTATITDRKNVVAARGEIELHRVAAKLTVSVDVKESYTPEDSNVGGGLTWYPEPESMTIELVNGVSRAVIGGSPIVPTEADYFRTPSRELHINGSGNYDADPFYSYPASWEVGDEKEPYLRIMLPWKTIINTEVDGVTRPVESFKNCYYKLILGGTELARNTWYDMLISIGVFGSFDEQEETILDITNTTYFVADWSTGLEIDSEIIGGRYLVVDKATYELFNENSIKIPVATSHPCIITDQNGSKINLNGGGTIQDDNYSISISDDGKYILFENILDNDMNSPTFDFSPYTFTFTIQHSDNNTYFNDIIIKQYPAVYGEAQRNTDYGNGGGVNGDNGFVWVNGYQDDDAPNNTDFFLTAPGFSNENADPHMYVFTVTSTAGTNYIIGDPRDMDYTYREGDARWYVGDAIYDGSRDRELNYYYGTRVASSKYKNANNNTGVIYANDEAAEAAEPTINMIAPKFRLASGYAVLQAGSTTGNNDARQMEKLKKRCASYQEDGYPAGRWRLPTRAEFQFIMTQIHRGNLPPVYLVNTEYWCAHGTGTPQNDGTIAMSYIGYDDAGHSVRCVYDEWYWENSSSYRLGVQNPNGTFTPSDTFTWGDRPREDFDLKQ